MSSNQGPMTNGTLTPSASESAGGSTTPTPTSTLGPPSAAHPMTSLDLSKGLGLSLPSTPTPNGLSTNLNSTELGKPFLASSTPVASSFALGRSASSGGPTSQPAAGGGGGGLFVGSKTVVGTKNEPWRVSVALDEGAPKGRKGMVCVYAQSATHNYTLLRTVKEIKETHDKLVASLSSTTLPSFPAASLALLDPSHPDETSSNPPPTPRRSSIRRAFSRLRESSRDRSRSASSSTADAPNSLGVPAPLGGAVAGLSGSKGSTPTIEEEDPLHQQGSEKELPPIPHLSPLMPPGENGSSLSTNLARSNTVRSTQSSSTTDGSVSAEGRASTSRDEETAASPVAALSVFLTVLANEQAVRESKVWRRFLRVRGDDMSSVRVERKIIRTHSAQGLHQSSLSSSIKGIGRSLRPPRTSDNGQASSTEDLAADDGVLIENEEEGGVLPEVDNSVPNQELERSLGLSFGRKKSDLTAVQVASEQRSTTPSQTTLPPVAAVSPLVDPIVTSSLEASPRQVDDSNPLTPDTAQEALSQAAFSPPFPDEDYLSSHLTPPTTSPHPHQPDDLAEPDVPYHEVLAAREAARQQALHNAESGVGNERQALVPPKKQVRISHRKVCIDDFELIRVLGKGCAGKVLLVRKKGKSSTGQLLALKSIVKRHVLAHQELQHTLTEQAVLRRMSRDVKNPFVVHLHYSFHDKDNLFLVMDFHPGGDLATQLARWGRFGRDRARFYAAEIVEGLQGLHAAGVVYRDLKPENILLDAAGHLVLTDFGLSKEFPRQALPGPPTALANGDVADFDFDPEVVSVPRWMQTASNGLMLQFTDQERIDWTPTREQAADRTTTFCGTAEYLAPEVIQGLPYSYAVDWWSFGTLLFEMLVGMTPFWAPNHSDMYLRVLHDELVFPEDRPIDQDTKSFLRGLLQKNPELRMEEPRVKKHPYFQMIDWSHLFHRRYIPPYTPPIDPENAMDTQNFDEAFLDMDPTIDGDAGGDGLAAAPSATNAAAAADMEDRASLWGGYSYRERDAASIFTVGSDYGSYGRKSGEILRSSLESSRVANGQPAADTPSPPPDEENEHPVSAPVKHEQDVSNGDDSLDSVDKPPPATSTSQSSLDDDSVHDLPLPLSPVSVHAHIGRTGIAAVDRDRSSVSGSEDEPDVGEETDEDEEDWDVIEKPRPGLQDSNGSRGATFFARGVVDRYRFGQLKKKESRLILQRSPPTPSTAPSTPPPKEASTPPTSFSARRGLTFKGGRFRRKVVTSDTQALGNLQTSSSAIKNSKSTPSSLSRSPIFGGPSTSPSLPASLGTLTDGSVSPVKAQPPIRSNASSPTKPSSRMASASASEDDGGGGGGGSKLKMFGRSGQEKVMNLFKQP